MVNSAVYSKVLIALFREVRVYIQVFVMTFCALLRAVDTKIIIHFSMKEMKEN